MPLLTLVSERFGPNGGIVAEGIERILGVQHLGNLELLVREAAQNSWDHRVPEIVANGHPVGFRVDLYQTTEHHRVALRDAGIDTAPPRSRVDEAFSEGKWALCISDRNCVGLRGPTRADIAVANSTPTNYRDFVLDIGHSGEGDRGGTYGFGKSAYFTAGAARLIVVHSRCVDHVGTSDRFLAIALGKDFDDGTARYTGRHWWGLPNADTFDPYTEPSEIAPIAEALGMPAFLPGQTGTSILILGVDLDEAGESAHEVAQEIGSHLMANIWPLTLPDANGCVGMDVDLYLSHERVALTPAADSPELRPFANCLAAIEGQDLPPFAGLVEKESVVLGDGMNAGEFAYAYFPRLDTESPLEYSAALLRSPRLVTQYLKPRRARTAATPELGLAAVFLAYPEMNDLLAKAEPPGHNDWDPSRLPARSGAKRQIRELMAWLDRRMGELSLDHKAPGYEPPGVTTTRLARQLGALLPVGAPPSPPPIGVGGGGSSRSLVLRDFTLVDVDDTFVEIRQDFSILWDDKAEVLLTATVSTATDDGDSSTPLDIEDSARYEPEVVAWILADGTNLGAQPDITVRRPTQPRPDELNTVVARFVKSTAMNLRLTSKLRDPTRE